MKKVKTYKSFVIAETNHQEQTEGNKDNYVVFQKDEWVYGEGLRNEEMECSTIERCIEFIDSY